MSGHTPGPWTFTPDPHGSLDDYMVGPLDGPADAVAVCSSKDARLIAAAPELLKELSEVLAWATVERGPLRKQEIDSIRAAIAKATGAQP